MSATNFAAGLGDSVGCASDWWSGGSIPTGSGNTFFVEFDHEIFSTFTLFPSWFKKGKCQFLVKERVQVLVHRLGDQEPVQEKCG